MIIDLSSAGTGPKRIDRTFEIADIDLSDEDIDLIGPVRFVAEIQKLASKTSLHGTIAVRISRDCTRCLEPVESDLNFEFSAGFVDSEQYDSKSDVELNVEDLDIAVADEGKIDLADVVREEILLALPIQNFCSIDCKGLCPKCGANLNLIDCKCSGDEVDPRWESLKNLK